jgi:hypothetical protein
MCACVEYYLINTNIVAESNHLNIKFIIMCNYQKMNPQPSLRIRDVPAQSVRLVPHVWRLVTW